MMDAYPASVQNSATPRKGEDIHSQVAGAVGGSRGEFDWEGSPQKCPRAPQVSEDKSTAPR